MAQRPSDTRPPDFEALEFEATNFDEARQALEELPPGVAELSRRDSGQWIVRRRASLPSDRALTGGALEWLLSLPPALRPEQLSQHFPRLVNALAAAWLHPPRARALLEDLLVDRRGDRRGLPRAMHEEVHALYEHLGHAVHVPSKEEELARARRLLEAAGYLVIAPGE